MPLAAACAIAACLSGCGVTEPGTNGAGALVVSTQSVNFGSVAIGQSASAAVSVSNTGSATVQLEEVQVQGAGFAIRGQSTAPINVAAGKSYSVGLKFDPTAAGATTGALILSSSVSSGQQMIVALSGTGEAAHTGPWLTLQSTSVPFGDVEVNTSATQTVQVTSSGTEAATINAGSATGAGFSLTGPGLPVTLDPGQATSLDIRFDPTTDGAATGAVTLATDTASGTATVTLSGTGVAGGAYAVDLSWDAPSVSSDAVAGYNIYRTVSGRSAYQLLNSSVDDATSYTDSSVQSGTSYTYYVVSVDGAGNQSVPSNLFDATVP